MAVMQNPSPVEAPKPMDSPIKKAPLQQQLQRPHAPSPSMFTPTSVLRKMTAEKETESSKMSDKKKAITGAQLQQPPRKQQDQLMGNLSQLDRMMQMQAQNDAFGKVNWDAHSSMRPQGRPIVKGAAPSQPQQSNPMMTQAPQQSNMMLGNFDFQQQQIQKMNLQKQFLQQQQQHHQQQQIMQMKKQQQMDNPVLTQFMAQHQQRTQQQQQQNNFLSQQFSQQLNHQQQQQQMMQGRPKEQDEMETRNMVNNGGCLSPTSNQLAKWFSPELLADASAGKLPSMKMNGGQMLSLEEFEKCIQNS